MKKCMRFNRLPACGPSHVSRRLTGVSRETKPVFTFVSRRTHAFKACDVKRETGWGVSYETQD